MPTRAIGDLVFPEVPRLRLDGRGRTLRGPVDGFRTGSSSQPIASKLTAPRCRYALTTGARSRRADRPDPGRLPRGRLGPVRGPGEAGGIPQGSRPQRLRCERPHAAGIAPEGRLGRAWCGWPEETLTETSKDLLVAARLTEGLTKEHGFGGLRDGLRLMRRLVTECWDRLNPAIESEDDLEVRAAPFYWLDEADRGARFPNHAAAGAHGLARGRPV